jgi:hypothetical protein
MRRQVDRQAAAPVAANMKEGSLRLGFYKRNTYIYIYIYIYIYSLLIFLGFLLFFELRITEEMKNSGTCRLNL